MIIKIITTVNHLCVWELSSKSTAQKHTRDGPAEFDLSLTAAWGAKMLAGTGPTPQMKDTEQFQFLPKVKNVITTFTTVSIPAFTPLSHRYVLKEHPAGDKKKNEPVSKTRTACHCREAAPLLNRSPELPLIFPVLEESHCWLVIN